ncbi:MAG: ABC transporter substrate-binding protein [Tabrizicola sp.]|nr:ABC transporter substrate-binding protein [Tabrizicola sp.]
MKHKTRLGLLAAALTLVTSNLAMAEAPESPDPIKIAVNEWTGQVLSATIAGEVLKKMGYNVELVIAGALPQLAAIEQGELDLNPEVWDNSVTEAYTNGLASGAIIAAGPLGLEPREGWVYPPYMEELCPGLPNYLALYDCAMAFGTAETFPNGRLVGYPADWGTRDIDVVKAIGLPFNVVPGGSEGAMVAELKSAIAAKEPILMMFWEPHWIHAEVELKFVEWNPVEGECVEETQVKETACGFAQAEAQKIYSDDFAAKYPAAAAAMGKFTLTNADQNAMILEVDQKGRTVEEVAAEWMAKNEAVWTTWIQ